MNNKDSKTKLDSDKESSYINTIADMRVSNVLVINSSRQQSLSKPIDENHDKRRNQKMNLILKKQFTSINPFRRNNQNIEEESEMSFEDSNIEMVS